MKRIFSLYLILCILIFATIKVADAKTWVEDFNTTYFDSWTKHNPENRSTWQPKDGRLDVWIQPPPPPFQPVAYPLEFTGFRFEVEKLNVKVRILEARNTGVGIFIGQYDGQESVLRRTLKILHAPVSGSVIGKPEEFQLHEEANINKLLAPLQELEIDYNKGDFEILSERKLLKKFHIPQLPTINCIGLVSVVGRGRGVVAHFVLDDFVISGPTVPAHGTLNVRAEGKTAVLWGELKRQ